MSQLRDVLQRALSLAHDDLETISTYGDEGVERAQEVLGGVQNPQTLGQWLAIARALEDSVLEEAVRLVLDLEAQIHAIDHAAKP